MKRNYHFSDEDKTIYMDIRLPGDEDWIKVTAGMARDANSRRQSNNERDAKRRITRSSPPPPHQPYNGSRQNKEGAATGSNATILGVLTNSSTATTMRHTTEEFPVSGDQNE